MHILVLILSVVIAILVLLLIVGLFLKKEFYIERSIVIHRTKAEVFNYLRFLKNAEHYNKWTMTDPSMKKTLTGTDGTTGFTYAWDSTDKNVGAGEQVIIQLQENERIDYELRFERPFKNVSYTSLILSSPATDQTTVSWTFHGKMNYPFNLLHAFLNLSKVLGKDLEKSLTNLKNLLEKKK